MSLTLKVITKITTEGTLLAQDAEHLGGSTPETLSGRLGLMNLTLGTSGQTQGMVPNLSHD